MTHKKENKFSYTLLKSYCDENKIILSKDYSTNKLTRWTDIEGNCINFAICGNTFDKTFDNLINNLIDGAKCYDCTKHNN
jgi:hypothetical protein